MIKTFNEDTNVYLLVKQYNFPVFITLQVIGWFFQIIVEDNYIYIFCSLHLRPFLLTSQSTVEGQAPL